MRIISFITNLLMGLVLSRFAISKLTGWEISVKAFIEMAKQLGIDPTFFRISTGILLTVVVLGYFGTAIFTLVQSKLETKSKVNYNQFALYANLLGLGTMVGALIAEFALRVEPKWLLVYIAIAVIVFSALNIFMLNANRKKQGTLKLATFK